MKGLRRAQSIDAHIGQRILEARRAQSMSQTILANRLGITFQQIQKYENGTNRVSAARLFEISHALEVPITYFYDGTEALMKTTQQRKASTAAPRA